MFRAFCGMLICAAGLYLLASSDMLINVSASHVIGSTPESRESLKLVAMGCVFGLLGLGSYAAITSTKKDDWLIRGVVLLASIFSAVLTIQATSVDYASNETAGTREHARRDMNKDSIKALEKNYKAHEAKWLECERDRYFSSTDCKRAGQAMEKITAQILAINSDTAQSVAAQSVDISDAVEEKAGLPAIWIERAGIYARAFFVPLMIYFLMEAFWSFWSVFFKESKSNIKKRMAWS
jgi:hypothetical protein